MRERQLEHWFEQFREHGDTGALGKVFDATAGELLRVARHLCANASDAEDLLQTTFLTAIENADRFDGDRRLQPWLLGILTRHTLALRRKRGQPERLSQEQVARDPADIVMDRELAHEVEKALADLPDVYREVLVPRLQDGSRGSEVAEQVGRDAATVRTQIRRGLLRLRQLLPRGLTTSTVLFFASRKSLAAIRREVLTHGSASSATASTVVSVGAGIVIKKLVVTALVLGLGAWTTVWLTTDSGEDLAWLDPQRNSVAERAAPEVSIPTRVAVAPAEAEPEESAQRIKLATTNELPFDPHHSPASRTGVRARLLYSDRTPVADCPMVLVEASGFMTAMNLSDIFDDSATDSQSHGRIAVGHARTDAEGFFELRGATPGGGHSLFIDPGGPRGTLVLLGEFLADSQLEELGDLVLPPFVTLSGRIVDEEGAPISGARVRAVNLPIPLGALGVHYFRSDTPVFRWNQETNAVAELPIPDVYREWWDRLPLPTDVTDDAGRFELRSVSRGLATVVVNHPGYVPTIQGPTPTGSRPSRELRDFIMVRGTTRTVTVVDDAGQPMEDVEVVVGPVLPMHPVGAGLRAARTDAEGNATLSALPEGVTLFAAAREGTTEFWSTVKNIRPDGVTLSLASPSSAQVRVLDPDQRPVLDADLRITSAQKTEWLRPRPVDAPIENLEEGLYRLDSLLPGDYLVWVQAPGFTTASSPMSIPSKTVTEIALQPGEPRIVRVLDPNQEPFPGVVLYSLDAFGTPTQATRTNSEGHAEIHPPSDHPMNSLLARSPGFADRLVKIPRIDKEPIQIVMGAGGAVAGKITEAGNPASSPYLVRMKTPPLMMMHDVSDELGAFRIEALSPGTHRYDVVSAIPHDNPIAKYLMDQEKRVLAQGVVVVREGETTELHLELIPESSPMSCSIEGKFFFPRSMELEHRVYLDGKSSHEQTLKEDGSFSIRGITPGEVRLGLLETRVEGTTTYLSEVHWELLTLSPGESRQHEVHFDVPLTVQLLVTDSRGKPIPGTSIQVHGVEEHNQRLSRFVETDPEGRAAVELMKSGMVRVVAEHQTEGWTASIWDPTSNDVLTLELDPGVPCAGIFAAPVPAGLAPQTRTYLRFARTDESRPSRLLFVNQPRGDFQIAGLAPGPYQVNYGWAGREESQPLFFELSDDGNRQLDLRFELQAP